MALDLVPLLIAMPCVGLMDSFRVAGSRGFFALFTRWDIAVRDDAAALGDGLEDSVDLVAHGVPVGNGNASSLG